MFILIIYLFKFFRNSFMKSISLLITTLESMINFFILTRAMVKLNVQLRVSLHLEFSPRAWAPVERHIG